MRKVRLLFCDLLESSELSLSSFIAINAARAVEPGTGSEL